MKKFFITFIPPFLVGVFFVLYQNAYALLPGDTNGDGDVDLGDFVVLASNFYKNLSGPTNADFNNDNTVNLADFAILASNFGKSETPTPTPTAGNLTCSTSTTLESLTNCITSHFGPFVIPSAGNQADWKLVVTKMLNGQCDFAPPGSLTAIYQIKSFTDQANGKTYCVAMEIKDANPADGKVDNGWGTFIVNNTATRDINHTAPHATSDLTTETQAVSLFKSTNSRTFLMSGSSKNVGTSNCQSSYAASDASHNIDHFFFNTVEALNVWYSGKSWWHIEWHGMAATTCPGVNAYISHGFSTPPPPDSKTLTLKQNILKYHPAWSVTVPGDSPSCSLNATQNVVGRFLNGVPQNASCGTYATSYAYKFIHIEQQINFRNPVDWHQAIIDTFP